MASTFTIFQEAKVIPINNFELYFSISNGEVQYSGDVSYDGMKEAVVNYAFNQFTISCLEADVDCKITINCNILLSNPETYHNLTFLMEKVVNYIHPLSPLK